MTGDRRPRRSLPASVTALLVVALTACGSGDDTAAERSLATAQEDKTSNTSAPEVTDGTVTVTGLDQSTETLTTVEGTDPPLTVADDTTITVQGADGPESLELDELASWLQQRRADLGATADGVAMSYEAHLLDRTAHLIALAEVPPG